MASITKSEKFVRSKKEQWEKLHRIVITLSARGFGSLTREEILTFPRLYRLTCADLAEAKMLRLAPDVLDYLNQLVGQAHKLLYSFPPLRKREVAVFFLETLPGIILKNWVYVVLSALFFFGSFGVTYLLVNENPSLANLIVPQTVLSQMENSYREPINEERSFEVKNFMVSFYIQNNVSIAFASFALGALLGLGAIYILIFNGIFLGAITGHIVGLGYGANFVNFVTAHSVLELTGLILAGAAGLALGYSIIKATPYTRGEWLRLQRRNIFTLVAAAGFLIAAAALIEGLISPSLIPYRYKLGVAVLSLLMLGGYFFLWPLMGGARPGAKRERNEAVRALAD